MTKIGRNALCPCGSGKKYKKCCLQQDELRDREIAAVLPEKDYGYEEESEPKLGEVVKTLDALSRDGLSFLWSKEEVEEYETGEIIRKLRSFGIEFDENTFQEDTKRFKSAEDLSDQWFKLFHVRAKGRDRDFPWFASMVLWDRLCPETPYAEQLDDRIDMGYSLVDEHHYAEACDIWLSVWEKVVSRFAPGNRSVEALDESMGMYHSFLDWCQEVEMELANAGEDNPLYYEKRIAFCTEFVGVFPDTSESILLNMRRAAAESWFGLGDASRGEEEFRKLTDDHPDWLWGYIGWGDIYMGGPNADLAKAESIYRMAQERGLDDRDGDLAGRLKDLEQDKGTHDARAKPESLS
jgi:hypothetical protein